MSDQLLRQLVFYFSLSPNLMHLGHHDLSLVRKLPQSILRLLCLLRSINFGFLEHIARFVQTLVIDLICFTQR